MNRGFGINDLVVTPTDRLARVTALIPGIPAGVWRAEIEYLDTDDSTCITATLLRPSLQFDPERGHKEQRIFKRKLEDDEIIPPCPTLYDLLFLMYVPGKIAPPIMKKMRQPRNKLMGREPEIVLLLKERDADGKPLKKAQIAERLGVYPTSLRKRIARMKKHGGYEL